MSAVAVKTCNFNCTCTHQDCSYYHHLPNIEDRIAFKGLYDSIYDKTKHNETDPEGCRKVVCKFGLLCNKEDCGFKHFCNHNGRAELCKSWWKEGRKRESARFVERIRYKMDAEELEQLMKLLGLSTTA